jgi:hypothetical protein
MKRVPLSRAAWIVGSEGKKTPCIVANLSESGAQVALLSGGRLPEHFTLSLEDRALCARVVWRSTWRLGVVFECVEPRLAA